MIFYSFQEKFKNVLKMNIKRVIIQSHGAVKILGFSKWSFMSSIIRLQCEYVKLWHGGDSAYKTESKI